MRSSSVPLEKLFVLKAHARELIVGNCTQIRGSVVLAHHRRETDVCVLATMLGAIDWGFRTIFVPDALCSSADETHDAMMNVYMNRFAQQVECVTTETILDSWPGRARAGLLS